MSKPKSGSKPFLTDVKKLRDRARKNISTGGVTFTYQGDVKKTIDILQSVLATEIVCVLRYTMHAVAATGISSEGVKGEFAQHAKEEQDHAMRVAERVLNEELLQTGAGSVIPTSGSGVETDGDTSYPWTMQTEPWPVDTMTQMTVQVNFIVRGTTYTMSASTLFDPNAATPGTGNAAGTAATSQ